MLNFVNLHPNQNESDSHHSEEIVYKKPLRKSEQKKERYFDPYSGAHFKYVELYERIFELKRYRKHVD
jgi:transposase-like protein